MPTPWMTSEDASDSQIKSFERAMFPEGFQGILGAGRSETACRWLEWRDAYLIESYQENERENGCSFQYFKRFMHLSLVSFG